MQLSEKAHQPFKGTREYESKGTNAFVVEQQMLSVLAGSSLGRFGDACPTANGVRDPHLHFAHGGTADFRGRHNALYNFLSAPGIALNVK